MSNQRLHILILALGFQVTADDIEFIINQTCLSVHPSLTALHVFRQPARGKASGGPPGPWCSISAALCQPVVQSYILVDEHLHYLRPQTTN